MGSRLEDRAAVITGAGSGFGRATALRFVEEGARFLALVDLSSARLEAVAAELSQRSSAELLILPTDLGDRSACHAVMDAALEKAPIDILVSNAAPTRSPTSVLELDESAWDQDFAVNVMASWILGRRAGLAMRDAGGGVILYTASISALGGERGFASYCATKAGIVALSQVMAVELAEFGIRVNCVSPGPADTQRSVDFLGEDKMAELRASFSSAPLQRLATADDVANAFVYLASDESAYVTGHNLVVDGGLSTRIFVAPDD